MLWNILNYTYHLLLQMILFFATDVLVESSILLCISWSLLQLGMNMLQKCQVQDLPGLIVSAPCRCAKLLIANAFLETTVYKTTHIFIKNYR